MAAIKNKNTKPELLIRKWLFALGLRYRVNNSKIPGHPDLYFAKYNTAIFVHGCYWHRHNGCKYAYIPKSNVVFWNTKFENNRIRDQIVQRQLLEAGIKCLVIWECTVKEMYKNIEYKKEILDNIQEFLESNRVFLEI